MKTTFSLGDVTIHRIFEQQAPYFDAGFFFPSLSKEELAEHRKWLEPDFIDPATGKIILCVQSYLVRTPQHTILVDSCVGNDKPRKAYPFWDKRSAGTYHDNLAAAGFSVHDIDFVMCTHLHTDHVGWNTRLENGRWVPTFPNARYLFSEREYGFWSERERNNPELCPWISDSVLPIVAADRADMIRSDHQLNDLVHLVPTPGHTIDHFSVQVGREGSDAFITGDMIHSPLQARHPEIGMVSDYDSAQAGRTRRTILERFCDTPTLFCTAHFPAPSVGHVRRWDEGYRIAPFALD